MTSSGKDETELTGKSAFTMDDGFLDSFEEEILGDKRENNKECRRGIFRHFKDFYIKPFERFFKTQ